MRTCAVTGTELALVRPLGFSTSSRHLKRAGLDYWHEMSIEFIDDLAAYLENTELPFYFFSSKAGPAYTTCNFPANALLIFGSETDGLPQIYHEKWPERFLSIPMRKNLRCLNLSNAASIIIYEALRQQGFPLMHTPG